MVERICPECGSDRWQAREYIRIRDQLISKQKDADRLARENGLLHYRLATAQAETVEKTAGLQRKITRQARAITRLERRLKDAGKKPWEGSKPGETVPGAERDATRDLPEDDRA